MSSSSRVLSATLLGLGLATVHAVGSSCHFASSDGSRLYDLSRLKRADDDDDDDEEE